jgi:regulator of protease activity HflC (stomatin/prohibitin superfamily)
MTMYDPVMTVERLTVSIDAELATAVRDAAGADDQNVSAWFADAARRQLAQRGLREVIAAWELEHGAFTDDELASARARVEG